MVSLAKPVVAYLTSRYRTDSTIGEYQESEKKLYKESTVNVTQILPSTQKDTTFSVPKREKKEPKQQRIMYTVDSDTLKRVKECMVESFEMDEDMSNNEV